MRKILIATTNTGKFNEIRSEFADLPYVFVSLTDLNLTNENLSEPYDTLEANAVRKASYYAKKSGLVTIAEDSGLFVDYLNGAPGVHTKDFAPTPKERVKKLLNTLHGVPDRKRSAQFKTKACLFDPQTMTYTVFSAETSGMILSKSPRKARVGMEYDSIFFYPPLKKTFSELSILEKNHVSHRGKVVQQLIYFLSRQYGLKQIMVACGFVVKDRKMLLLKRRDTRPEFNNKWEFPGGMVDGGETLDDCLHRELKEETGYTVKVLDRIPKLYGHVRGEGKGNYQVFLACFVCEPTGGKLQTADNEAAGHTWMTLKQLKQGKDFMPRNKEICIENAHFLKKYID